MLSEKFAKIGYSTQIKICAPNTNTYWLIKDAFLTSLVNLARKILCHGVVGVAVLLGSCRPNSELAVDT